MQVTSYTLLGSESWADLTYNRTSNNDAFPETPQPLFPFPACVSPWFLTPQGRFYFTHRLFTFCWSGSSRRAVLCFIRCYSPGWGIAVPASTMCSVTIRRTMPSPVESWVHWEGAILSQFYFQFFNSLFLLICIFFIQQSKSSRSLCCVLLRSRDSHSSTRQHMHYWRFTCTLPLLKRHECIDTVF